jgi:hypothetical protein
MRGAILGDRCALIDRIRPNFGQHQRRPATTIAVARRVVVAVIRSRVPRLHQGPASAPRTSPWVKSYVAKHARVGALQRDQVAVHAPGPGNTLERRGVMCAAWSPREAGADMLASWTMLRHHTETAPSPTIRENAYCTRYAFCLSMTAIDALPAGGQGCHREREEPDEN